MSEPTNQCSFSDLIQSDLFTFKIGEEGKAFVVHSNAIATTSEPFRALVTGGLNEAETRTAELKDVEPEDFVRFLEYAYRRDYTVPSWVIDESNQTTSNVEQGDDPPPPPPDEPQPASTPWPEDEPEAMPVVDTAASPPLDEWGFAAKSVKKKKKAKAPRDMTTLRSNFQRRHYLDDGAPSVNLLEGFQPKSNSAANQDFTPVFLAHARLYAFADMRLIYPLKKLALHKLHKTLMDFQLYNGRVGDIIELARYAYDHGPDRSKGAIVNDLRLLVVEYMACEVDIVGKHKDFKALLEEGGEFVTDFWGIVAKFLL